MTLGKESKETPRNLKLVLVVQLCNATMLKSVPLFNGADGTTNTADPGVEINVSKSVVEPVWFLPGVADQFKFKISVLDFHLFTIHMSHSSESFFRRALFEETGPDIKVFLPPRAIGGMAILNVIIRTCCHRPRRDALPCTSGAGVVSLRRKQRAYPAHV